MTRTQEAKVLMEKFRKSDGNSKLNGASKAPIAVTDFESRVIEDLNLERFQQSKTIAQQLDTIGKLKAALGQMVDRTTRRRSLPQGPAYGVPISPSDEEPTTVCVQTDAVSNGDLSTVAELHQRICLVNAENRRLQVHARTADSALKSERAKARRIIEACARIASPHGPVGLSSPALAKWVSMGLEDTIFTTRTRTETFDDSALPRVRRLPLLQLGSLRMARSRDALSEGDSPVAGLDLDMVYGSFEAVGVLTPSDAVAMTPRSSSDYLRSSDPIRLTRLAGTYWTGSTTGVLRFDRENPLCLTGLWESGTDQFVELVSKGEGVVMRFLKTGDTLDGLIEGENLVWATGGLVWEKLPNLSYLIAGEWWTGFSTIALDPKPDLSGTCVGQWGMQTVELMIQSKPVEKSDRSAQVVAVLGLSGVCMYGSLEPRYATSGTPAPSVIRWGNGQTWER